MNIVIVGGIIIAGLVVYGIIRDFFIEDKERVSHLKDGICEYKGKGEFRKLVYNKEKSLAITAMLIRQENIFVKYIDGKESHYSHDVEGIGSAYFISPGKHRLSVYFNSRYAVSKKEVIMECDFIRGKIYQIDYESAPNDTVNFYFKEQLY
jgi:hypothetical protein